MTLLEGDGFIAEGSDSLATRGQAQPNSTLLESVGRKDTCVPALSCTPKEEHAGGKHPSVPVSDPVPQEQVGREEPSVSAPSPTPQDHVGGEGSNVPAPSPTPQDHVGGEDPSGSASSLVSQEHAGGKCPKVTEPSPAPQECAGRKDPSIAEPSTAPQGHMGAPQLVLPESQGKASGPQEDAPVAAPQSQSLASGEPVAAAEPASEDKGVSRAVKNPPQKAKPEGQVGSASSKETESKGGAATREMKTGEPRTAVAEDPKKQGGGDRSYAAAVRKEKEPRKESAAGAGAQKVPASPPAPGEGVVVYFHAILSKHFDFTPDRHVVVRGGDALGAKSWTSNVCEMHYVKDLQEDGYLLEGSMVIPRQSLDTPIPYKYVILTRGQDSVEYEFIYKKQKSRELVNRCLRVKSHLAYMGDWHQYDDIICMKPPGKIQKAVDWFSDGTRRSLVEGKRKAATIMLDRIFSVLQPWSLVNLRAFLVQFQQFYFVVQQPVIYEGGLEVWDDLRYTEKEVKKHLWGCLKLQMAPFLERRTRGSPPEACPGLGRLRIGLLILFAVEYADISLSEHDLRSLSCLLVPSATSSDALDSDLSHFLSLPFRWREHLVHLCHRCMKTGVSQWLGTLPVLHYCMKLPPPRVDLGTQQEDAWAALEGIPFSEFRDGVLLDQNQLLQFMEKERHLLQVDPHLFRSWLSLLPLESLVFYMENATEFLSHEPARILDCFVGISYRLAGLRELSPRSVKVGTFWDAGIFFFEEEDVESVFNMLLYLVDMYKDMIPEETVVQTFLPVCLRLHKAVCGVTKSWEFYALPALSAQTVGSFLRPRPLVDMEAGPGAEARSNAVTSTFQGTLAATRSWLSKVLPRSMFYTVGTRAMPSSIVQFSCSEEMEIWRRLVDIDFPVEHSWKESLLEEMEQRLKKEKPLTQISAFCGTQWDAASPEDSVARSFEKCVIEAVSSACQSQTSILDGLSCHDWKKFGTLLSAVITKSWPRRNGQAVDDPDEIFKHLITWPDVKQLFKLYGTDEKLIANITVEGQNLMAVADSVFTKVAQDLQDRTILVGQLELLLKHQTQFLHIWKLKKDRPPFHETQSSMDTVVSRSLRDLVLLRKEAHCVQSLLRQCEKTRHLVQVDFGELEAAHMEDVSSRRLCDVVMVTTTSLSDERTTCYHLSAQAQEMARSIDALANCHTFQILWEAVATELRDSSEGESASPILELPEVSESLYSPCHKQLVRLYADLRSGAISFAQVDALFKDFVGRYEELTSELKTMCVVEPSAPRDWIPARVRQIQEYHSLHQAASSAKVILRLAGCLELTGDFSVLRTLLNFTDKFPSFCHETLDQISPQLIQAKKLLQDITELRHRCLEELSLQTELVRWLHEALEGINELKVFVDLASISAGENDIDVDRVACFHDAVQGYAPLLYDLDKAMDFQAFMDHLQELWKALDSDQHLPQKLRDSARNLEWLKTVKESHGSVELSSLALATAINSQGVYLLEAPKGGQKISPHDVLRLLLPESHGASEQWRSYSLEELKELLNKLMLMSGKKDHNSEEVERFSEVFSSVQRLLQTFLHLYEAGNLLFRTWRAQVHCCPREDHSIRMCFGLGLMSQLAESGDVTVGLEALCRQMEHFLEHWRRFVSRKRTEHFYLNFYTAEQLVYLSCELPKRYPSEAALTMLSFIKASCTAGDVRKAFKACSGKATPGHKRTGMEDSPLLLVAESPMVVKLRAIMELSLQSRSPLLPDTLDLDVLGCCLAQLASMAGPPVERPLPRGLQPGQPNLVLCSMAEVLPATLAVYMEAPSQPLPTFEEVLLCTPVTTLEEVALLLRRCLTAGCRGRGIYSLLFADQLSYEVGCQAEVVFQRLCSQHHREDFQLVLVCDAAREHHLPSAFSQHKVLLTPEAPLRDIQAYLAHHYQVPEGTPSAAEAFRDRMCVGIVASERAGVGKSLYVKRLHGSLEGRAFGKTVPLRTIRLTDAEVDESQIVRALLPFLDKRYQRTPVVFHFDVTASVQTGVWGFLFKLLVLQYLMDVNGKMWLRNPCHLYVVEILEGKSVLPKRPSKLNARVPQFGFLDMFPKVICRPPKEVIDMELTPGRGLHEPRMDPKKFRSETFQRPYQYLRRFHQKENLDSFQYQAGSVEGSPEECLQHLLIYCGVLSPSWSELRNFARFLNCQLRDCEASVYCNADFVGDTLRGFKNFVVTFMIIMARDFATPTLQTSDQSPGNYGVTLEGASEEDLAPFSLRKKWESEPHPYVFFNGDHITMTFMGFFLQANAQGGVDAVSHLDGTVIKSNVMSSELYRGLLLQKVPFNIDFDALPRQEKLERLCRALGIQWVLDPDDTYELTTDNMLKILAIEMRFRCGIPVILMGETGCGKTRLIKFLSDLRRAGIQADTMKLVKVHGGTTKSVVYSKVKEAQDMAIANKDQHQLDTILFLDEANTTEAISCIKEVLCDHTVDGQPLEKDSGLHIVAACNPYRKHTQEVIDRLEAAGLGYRVQAQDTSEKLGSIPLRQLVYRVHALPPSLIPLVWDFGQLNDIAEKLYIHQIVQRLVDSVALEESKVSLVADVLSASQSFMRRTRGECSFVSLRDVERCVQAFTWFVKHSQVLLGQLGAFLQRVGVRKADTPRDPVLWSLVLAIGVCYHASLDDKEAYRKAVCRVFPKPYDSSKAILEDITLTQDLFLSGVPLRRTIARNLALKENVFMMVVCIELRIPLFLVGKPGSSKSLAKTIVADAMQGPAAHSDLFRRLKQVHLVSFQCSPHSTPQGIIGTFKQCARFQQDKDLRQYVSVVVLDEVGLAEDSPKMPLKTLHPLLEDGCIEDDPAPHKKVGFIGISNWALDPAKMNRGIFVSRGSPSKEELTESARGICCSDKLVQERIQGYFVPLARAYERVCQLQDKEFFGLRDYYSLIKMVFAAAHTSNGKPSPRDIARAILRNFSGKDDICALDIFTESLPEARCAGEVSTVELIKENIHEGLQRAPGARPEHAESRYLLVLTRNYVALQILQHMFFRAELQPEIIFGSSFPQDQEYTQICRNINRVKVCMETGRMVVLLNLQSLYESLYDALNQYYVHLGGQQYVDLGLGTHRVKCRVHPAFRLIVIEEKEVVYRQFPVPLINRLEKHYLDLNTVLEDWQRHIVDRLAAWVRDFANTQGGPFLGWYQYSPTDVFIGYHSDACAAAVLQAMERQGAGARSEELCVMEEAKLILLDCATPDAVVRLGTSKLGSFAAQQLANEYCYRQQHSCFADFLQDHLRAEGMRHTAVFTEITTFSRLLTSHDAETLVLEVPELASKPTVLLLQKFDTEHSFLKEIRNYLTSEAGCKILIIQTDFDDGIHSAQLVASAKYSALNEINKAHGRSGGVFVYFITKLSRMGSSASYVGFHGGLWRSVHIDDLRRSTVMASDVTRLQNVTISQLFEPPDLPECESAGGRPDGQAGVAANGSQEEMDTEPSWLGGRAETDMDVHSSEKMETGTSDPRGSGNMAEAPDTGRVSPSQARVLDTTRLLQSCVQSAVGMLCDQDVDCVRNTRRLCILLSLLSEDDRNSASFLEVAKLRLCLLLKKQEEGLVCSPKEWVAREAGNQEALQEASTFRHTLWKRVQGAVTPLLANMVALLDRDANLELLTRPDLPTWARDLWMFIFKDDKLLQIPLVTSHVRSQAEMASITVQNDMHLVENASNEVPFSWRIKDYLEELWVQAQYITDAEGLPRKMVEIFQQTPLGRFLSQLPEEQQLELLQAYAKDFLLLTMRLSSREELQFLQTALWSCLGELQAAWDSPGDSPEDRLSLPWVHLAYQHFRTRLQNFARILTIHPPILHPLTQAAQQHSLARPEMTLDAFAALACVELLTRDTLQPSPQAWVQVVKTVATPLELLCSDGYLRGSGSVTRALVEDVRAQWNRISSVALFVEHVVLGTMKQVPELSELVTRYMSQLDKCLQDDSNVKTQRPFSAVMSTLCECKERASRTLARFGIQPCLICLGDTQEPVCLPCEHVFCLACLRGAISLGQMLCPHCKTALPDTFSLTPSPEHREAVEKHARFRHLCNGFFLDLVSSLCFKGNSPPEAPVVRSLLAMLFVRKDALRGAPGGPLEHTKSLSPFDDVVDRTPVTRSVVLKLLLKYSFREVKDYIQDYLSLLEKKAFVPEDKTELYVLFVSCLEDSVYARNSACAGQPAPGLLQEEGSFLQTVGRGSCHREPATVECLQEVARIRLCLDRASDFLAELPELSEDRQYYLWQVRQFCTRSGNDWCLVYLVRQLVNLRGMEFVQGLCQQGHPCQWVFPKDVIVQQKDHMGQMDGYLVHGEEYKALRDAVGTAVLKGKTGGLQKAFQPELCNQVTAPSQDRQDLEPQQVVCFLLALYREMASPSQSPSPEQREAVNKFIEKSKVGPESIRHFATSLVDNTLPLLNVGPGNSRRGGTVTEMAVHAAAVLLCGKSKVLEPLRNLAFSPATMVNAFLPTMPEDLLAEARTWKGLEGVQWYTCPYGHACAVGECGRPMEQSVCVDCHSPVGGSNHKPCQGFQVIQGNVDRTQTGHVLGNPQSRDAAAAPDRELSPVVFLLLRLLTHLALLLGAAHHPQALRPIIKPPVGDPVDFLRQHLQRDLEQLTRTLGKSADEASHVVHIVLRSLLLQPSSASGHGSSSFNAQLSTKGYRNNWEKHAEALLLPELKRLDRTLLTVNALISQDDRVSSNPVARIVYGDPATFLPHLPRTSPVHCSKIWSCRKRVTAEYLQHVVEQQSSKDAVPVLWHFLKKEAELRLVKFLPEILALQRSLVNLFQNVAEMEPTPIWRFISRLSSEGLRKLFQDRITLFLSTWNALRRSLETNGGIKLPKDFCSNDLDLDSDIEVLLPRRSGRGLCSTALVNYLITLHNEVISMVKKLTKDSSSYSVDASEVTDLHVISYDVERDLTPLILSNCQYQVAQGGETSQEFDLDKIQRQLCSRLLQGKPQLTLKGLPTLVHRQDRNYEHLLLDIKNKMAQSALPSMVASTIGGQLQSYSDTCEALSVVEVALGFLSTAGEDPNMQLNVYIQDVLRMGEQPVPVLTAFSGCQVRHASALWQLLSAHKSEQLLRLKKEPFREISPRYKAELSPQQARLLGTFLNHAALDVFLLELHEMMVLRLKNPRAGDAFSPKWCLRDTLVNYMERKNSAALADVETQFPAEIPLSACVSVWKAAAARRRDRQDR
ncbi:E3 ubiquitin-protein ligase RNF213 [Ctenodactylus gundi]